MGAALILTIIPVMLIVTVLMLSTGALTPLAAVGFASLLGLVVIVFVGLLRSARRMQPSADGGDPTRSEDRSTPTEDETGTAAGIESSPRIHEDRDPIAARSAPDAENSIATWNDEGGSPRPEPLP